MYNRNKNYLISILITNYNKSKYLSHTLNSIKKQKYRNFEIIIFDDCSTDNSNRIIENFKIKNKKVIYNKKKFSQFSELNQINGLKNCLKVSKGKIICLLDGDDKFHKNKLEEINNFFIKKKKCSFLIDQILNQNQNFFKRKYKIFRSWPIIYPTSCISMRKEFFIDFYKKKFHQKFNLLAIDLRLLFFAKFFLNDHNIINKKLTYYRYYFESNENKYIKFNKIWWLRRYQAFAFLKLIYKRKKVSFKYNLDYFITYILNFFLKK